MQCMGSIYILKNNQLSKWFQEIISVKCVCLAATENRISWKWFQFDRNFTSLTRKWFYTFILPSNHFRVTRKRERESERKREREKERRESRDCPKPSSSISSTDITGTAPIARYADCADCDLAFASIAIARSVRIWWFFFSGFCLCFEEWMILYIHLATEKMWATGRKCVFYGIFKNTTKHQKIFFETSFEMQPNTWKHFPFWKIAFPKNRIFSRNTFTRTKRSLNITI